MQTVTDDFGAEFAPDDDPFRQVPQVPPQPQMPALFEILRVMRGPSRFGHYFMRSVIPCIGRNGQPGVLQETRVAALNCGCIVQRADQIARCPCCDRVICHRCRRPCADCEALLYAGCLRRSDDDGRRLCNLCYEA